MDAAHKLLEKAPPADLEKNVKSLSALLQNSPDAKERLLKSYLMPFTVYRPTDDEEAHGERPFVMCQRNCVGDQYRSPWTHVLYPRPPQQNIQEASKYEDMDELMMEIEGKFNVVWDAYTQLYYGHDAVSSVFLTETERGELTGFFAVQKACDEGSWNSMHFMSMEQTAATTCDYRITSHVLLVLKPEIGGNDRDNGDAAADAASTTVDWSASMSKETVKTLKVQPAFIMASHIENIGSLLEANEIDIRSNLERVYIPNTVDVTDALQKEPEAPKAANPLAGMVLSADMLKKRKGVRK